MKRHKQGFLKLYVMLRVLLVKSPGYLPSEKVAIF